MPDMTPLRKMVISRALRRRSTYTENIAWNLLRDRRFLDLKFRRQYGVAGFIVDFYCPDLSLAIEIDGSSHCGREGYDDWRQEKIEKRAIRFIRVTNEVLESNPEILLNHIREFVEVKRIKTALRVAETVSRKPLTFTEDLCSGAIRELNRNR